ncbi:translation initiation factor IF-2 [Perkinsela sp. CCAP 1560/4]|nr:translation initiation factor IF-2 [Perkinsela sp. CCAP 1560/4]|eukprot:KNH08535.1 translation initiation factor IF-2 [Perkinsela sp. CCAP 1560/4]
MSAKSTSKNSKTPSSGLNALKAKLQKAKEAEEQRRKKEEEERRRIEEEMQRIEEEEQRKADEKKTQKDAKATSATSKQNLEMKKKLDSLRRSGLLVPDVMETDSSPQILNRNVYSKKKTTSKSKTNMEKEDIPVEAAYRNTDKEPENGEPSTSEAEDSSLSADEGDRENAKISSWEDLLDDPYSNMLSDLLAGEKKQRHLLASQEKQIISDMETSCNEEMTKIKSTSSIGKVLRSPICCVLGHVDAGKTSLLDKLRQTNLQGAEAGGITQQIGCTFFPLSTIVEKTAGIAEKRSFTIKIPGLLVIDTPGHESFANLRSRGSSLCDIAIVIIDLTKGIEPQTRESFALLREKKCSFVVAMNKVDRIYGWEPSPGRPIEECIKKQSAYVVQEYNTRVAHVMQQLMEEGFNSALYYQNKDFQKIVSLVPVSAHTGEGIPDLLVLLVQLMQKFLANKVSLTSEFRCSVLEVKKMEGQGTTLDVILVNGTLSLGDTIVISGTSGPIVTTIRALITPQPCRETRTKGDYIFHQKVHASCGVKIAAHDLEDAIAGSPLLLLEDPGNETAKKEAFAEVMKDLDALKQSLQLKPHGVCVQASTMGSLEALLRFLKENSVDVAHVAIGPLHKRHVLNSLLVKEKCPQKAAILAFDVPITKEAQEIAEANSIPIFAGQVIYRLLGDFQKHCERQKLQAKEANRKLAVFPASFKILKTFRSTDPIILGVEVLNGQLRPHAPCFTMKDNEAQVVGTITSIEHDGSQVSKALEGQTVAIKIQPSHPHLCMGRHVAQTGVFHSHLTRQSINALKESFRDEMKQEDWRLVIELKKLLSIV